MYKAIVVIVLSVLANSAAADITEEQLARAMQLISDENYDSAFALIQEFKRANPEDPEYFVLSINYYFMKSQHCSIEIAPGEPKDNEPTLIIEDSVGATVAHLKDHTDYNLDTLNLGLEILRRGLTMYPTRLDMHFGLVHVCEESGLLNEMALALRTILELGASVKGDWLWTQSEPLQEDPATFILENVQTRIGRLFEQDSPLADSVAVALSEALTKHYPNSAYGHSNLGYFFQIKGDLEKSISHYTKALVIDSTDAIVLANLAQLNEDVGRVSSAIQFYEQLLRVGTLDFHAMARQKLQDLNK
jgi:tetratricopeptide (TPR) repeat protein